METPGSTPDTTQEDIRSLFLQFDEPAKPVSVAEVAEELGCTRQIAHEQLAALTESGELQTTSIDGTTQVWWQSQTRTVSQQSDHEQFSAFVTAVKDYAIFMLNPDGTVASWNDGAERIKDYKKDEIVGEHFSTFYTEADLDDGVPEQNLESAATEGRVEDEGWRLQKDGSRFWAYVTITAIRDDDGRLQGFTKVTRDMTERREYEQQLEQRKTELETELSVILGRVSDAFCALDEEWRFTHLNDQAAELMGESTDELLGKKVWEVLPEANESRYREEFQKAMDTQRSTSFEVFAEDIDAWLEYTVYPSESGLSIYFQDITGRKEREQKLERYKTVFDTVTDGIYILGPDFHFEEVNEAYADLTGYDPEELIGSHCSRVVGDDVSSDAATLSQQLSSGERDSATLEADVITAEDDRIPAESKFSALPSPDGTFRGSVGVVRDLTERKEYERKLEKRARQEEVVADLGELALDHDDVDSLMENACQLVSETLDMEYCKVLDLDDDSEELLLRQGVGWQPGIVGTATVDANENSQAGYTLLSEEAVVVTDLTNETRFSGPELLTSHDVKSGISVIIGSVNNPWGILGTHDTVRREFSEEDVNFIQSIANILMTAVERHQYEVELTETVEELKESNKRLEQFAYLSSHDLQEPLRMISNYLQLLDEEYRDDLDEDAHEFIDYAVDAANRMRAMIEDLLSYSRIESHAEPFEPTDCNDVVDRVREQLQLQIDENDAELVVGDLPTIVADGDQLEQVFQNLISNAIKYQSDAPPRIEIDATKRENEWMFQVKDNGIGIDSKYTDKIFDIFKRLHTHEAYQGTGIGLALCKKIVNRHNGEIWVESESGDGSTFYFTVSTEQAHLD